MADEIIKELWKIKDDIAEEFGYDVRAFVSNFGPINRKMTWILLTIGIKRKSWIRPIKVLSNLPVYRPPSITYMT